MGIECLGNTIYLFSLSPVKDEGIKHINSLHIRTLKQYIDFSRYDYIIITSKQAIASLESFDVNWKTKKVLAISNPTAKAVAHAKGVLIEVGNGYGDNLSDIICSYPKSTRWLYLRAKEVATDFVSTCKEKGYCIDEKIVYETSCSKEILQADIPEEATLIFTSPSSIKCFLKTHNFMPLHNIIVIGKTTAQALPFGVDYSIADEPSIESCIKKARG